MIVPPAPPPAEENLPVIVRAVLRLVLPSPITFSVVQLIGPRSLVDFRDPHDESE